jgi:hypothetical protein
MPFHRILVLQSVEDDITEYRMWRMHHSPSLVDYEFENCYAIELTDEQKTLPTDVMMMQVENAKLDENRLVDRLTQKIATFKPDLVVVHFGFAFMRFPKEMFAVLRTLRTRFPALKLGVELAESLIPRIPGGAEMFDDNDEIRDLITHMF